MAGAGLDHRHIPGCLKAEDASRSLESRICRLGTLGLQTVTVAIFPVSLGDVELADVSGKGSLGDTESMAFQQGGKLLLVSHFVLFHYLPDQIVPFLFSFHSSSINIQK